MRLNGRKEFRKSHGACVPCSFSKVSLPPFFFTIHLFPFALDAVHRMADLGSSKKSVVAAAAGAPAKLAVVVQKPSGENEGPFLGTHPAQHMHVCACAVFGLWRRFSPFHFGYRLRGRFPRVSPRLFLDSRLALSCLVLPGPPPPQRCFQTARRLCSATARSTRATT